MWQLSPGVTATGFTGRGVKAYGPDYVVTMPTTMGQLDAVYPGEIEAQIESQREAGTDAAAPEALRSQLPSVVRADPPPVDAVGYRLRMMRMTAVPGGPEITHGSPPSMGSDSRVKTVPAAGE